MIRRIGKYSLQKQLGAGGMGTVWQAFDETLQREVALKLMNSFGVSGSARERFRIEARAIARLRSEHVVDVYDFDFTEDGTPYIVMELLQGETLSARLARLGPVPSRDAIPIVAALCEGLAASHAAGIIHRDLKPQNIFLCSEGRGIIAKLLDFGVADMRLDHDREQQLTEEHQLPGTPGYMSPEQIQGEPVDERSDLWSLAIICYEMLSGKNPFAGPVFTATLLRIVSAAAPPASTLVPGASAALDDFFVQALAKAPSQRFQTAREFGAALVRLLEELAERGTISVLVVDDEPDTSLLIEQSFEEERNQGTLRFAFANSGVDALRWLSEHGAPDVIMTDLNMPEMDGLTLLDRVLTLYPGTRSIVVTAYGDMGNVRKAMNCGAFDFLVKPIDLDDLAKTVIRAATAARDVRGALTARRENTALRQLVASDLLDTMLPQLRNFAGAVLYEDVASVMVVALHPAAPGGSGGELVETLNAHLDTVTAFLERFGGLIARYHGETAVAIFRGDGHEERAAKACLESRDATRHLTDLAALRLTYGIDTGSVTVATVGAPSRKRFECAVVGATARTASALSRLSRGDEVLVSQATWQALSDADFCVAVECVKDAATGLEAWSLDRSGSLSSPASVRRAIERPPASLLRRSLGPVKGTTAGDGVSR